MSTHRVFHRLASSLLLLVALLVLLFPAVAHAEPDPAIGNWKLNLGKSKYTPGTAPMNLRVVIEAAGQGIRVTSTTLRANQEDDRGAVHRVSRRKGLPSNQLNE